jgi:tRNA threonylcarbamoyladenosine biosynthesis protein TsaB
MSIDQPTYILNIETATKNCSVSISKDGNLIALKEICEANFSHAEKLHNFIKDILKESNLTFEDLSAIAISKGPGSYTGLRIGVSTAKGLCFALDIPLISILTLEALAHAIKIDSGYIIPLLDARRQEVYTAIFDSEYKPIKETYNYILEENSFAQYDKITFIGDGATKTKEIISHPNATFLEGYYPSAKEMISLSYKKFCNKIFEDVAYFEPFYLKDFHVTLSKKKAF